MVSWGKLSVLVAVIAIGVWYYTRPDPIAQLDVHGSWDPKFKQVADVFRESVKSGKLRGGSFAAYLDGKPVVNIWGGYRDEDYQMEWTEDTVTIVYSSTKLVAAIAFSLLIDRGLIDYDDLVTKYWPEFGQNGKDNVTVNMFISHQAGLNYFDEEIGFREVVTNPERIDRIIEKQKPHWPPGTAFGYHTVTIGMLLESLARKVDPKKRPLHQIYEEDLRVPLDLEFYTGLPHHLQYRAARVYSTTTWDAIQFALFVKSNRAVMWNILTGQFDFTIFINGLNPYEMAAFTGDPDLRATPILAVGGYGTAGSMAKLFGLVAARTPVKGKPILSERIIQKLITPSITGIDRTVTLPATMGHGTFIMKNPWGQDVFGHPGAGGQVSYCDPTNKVGLAFITNYFGPFALQDDLRFVGLEKAFYDCLTPTK